MEDASPNSPYNITGSDWEKLKQDRLVRNADGSTSVVHADGRVENKGFSRGNYDEETWLSESALESQKKAEFDDFVNSAAGATWKDKLAYDPDKSFGYYTGKVTSSGQKVNSSGGSYRPDQPGIENGLSQFDVDVMRQRGEWYDSPQYLKQARIRREGERNAKAAQDKADAERRAMLQQDQFKAWGATDQASYDAARAAKQASDVAAQQAADNAPGGKFNPPYPAPQGQVWHRDDNGQWSLFSSQQELNYFLNPALAAGRKPSVPTLEDATREANAFNKAHAGIVAVQDPVTGETMNVQQDDVRSFLEDRWAELTKGRVLPTSEPIPPVATPAGTFEPYPGAYDVWHQAQVREAQAAAREGRRPRTVDYGAWLKSLGLPTAPTSNAGGATLEPPTPAPLIGPPPPKAELEGALVDRPEPFPGAFQMYRDSGYEGTYAEWLWSVGQHPLQQPAAPPPAPRPAPPPAQGTYDPSATYG